MRRNLAVYVLYHSQYSQGKAAYSDIYKLLCRDADHPFEDGLDIPVYLRTGDDDTMRTIRPIDVNSAEKIYILLLIDDNMYCSDVWQRYISQIVQAKADNNDRIVISCIALSKFAFDIGHNLSERQFIRLNTLSIKDNWQEFQIRLFDSLIRFIKSTCLLTKLKIFISHSKKDENKIGLTRALEFRDYIRSKTKLDSFFDASDILDGENFEQQLNANATSEASLLVILNSNTYSEREWCQKEVLYAKKSKVPTIAVSLLDGQVKRSFPYISNIPYIRFNDNWNDVLILILRTALDQYCQAEYLENLRADLDVNKRDSYAVLPFSPEAYSYVYDELKSNIIYPEPPLTKDELDVLKTLARVDKKFLTPMQLLAETVNISGKSVAISVSESPDSDILGYGSAMIRDLTIELSRHLLIAGAKMVYGGDLRDGGFTELFSELSLQYKEYQGEVGRDTFFFKNFFAWPIWLNFGNEMKLRYTNSRVDYVFVDCPEDYTGDKEKPIAPINNETSLIYAKSLTKMRREMETSVDARVILGGCTHGYKGFMSGIAEEYMISVRAGHPIYLLGGFGGAASILAKMIQGKSSISELTDEAHKDNRYAGFFKFCNANKIGLGYEELDTAVKKGISGLNNGLSDDDNIILLHSTDVIEIVGLILKGLKNKLGHA